MSYRHILNLYASKEILLFKQCYETEKVHGTSAHFTYKVEEDRLTFFHGGANREQFLKLFNQEELLEKFRQNKIEHNSNENITIYGEAIGGKMQGMSHTYGKDLFFIGFEVCIGNSNWLDVSRAHHFCEKMGIEFVPYSVINTTEDEINAAMMKDSEVAIRKGMGTGHMREGVVLRPLREMYFANNNTALPLRVKHKRPEFSERKHTPKFSDPAELKLIEDADKAAEEFTVFHRLEHVLQKLPEVQDISQINKVIKAMIEDVLSEGGNEIQDSKLLRKAIGKRTVKLFKEWLACKS
jgi:hypothetical protein